jgi:hypothetical protein
MRIGIVLMAIWIAFARVVLRIRIRIKVTWIRKNTRNTLPKVKIMVMKNSLEDTLTSNKK